jgi:hypothetical protein
MNIWNSERESNMEREMYVIVPSQFVFFIRYCYDNLIKKTEINGTNSAPTEESSVTLLCLTLANLHSALVLAWSDDLREATFIFFACSLICFSWAATACHIKAIGLG